MNSKADELMILLSIHSNINVPGGTWTKNLTLVLINFKSCMAAHIVICLWANIWYTQLMLRNNWTNPLHS